MSSSKCLPQRTLVPIQCWEVVRYCLKVFNRRWQWIGQQCGEGVIVPQSWAVYQYFSWWGIFLHLFYFEIYLSYEFIYGLISGQSAVSEMRLFLARFPLPQLNPWTPVSEWTGWSLRFGHSWLMVWLEKWVIFPFTSLTLPVTMRTAVRRQGIR